MRLAAAAFVLKLVPLVWLPLVWCAGGDDGDHQNHHHGERPLPNLAGACLGWLNLVVRLPGFRRRRHQASKPLLAPTFPFQFVS